MYEQEQKQRTAQGPISGASGPIDYDTTAGNFSGPYTSDRPAIGGRFREGSIGTAPVGSIEYTTTAGNPTGATGDFTAPVGATGSWGGPGPIAAQAGRGFPGAGYVSDQLDEAKAMAAKGNVAGMFGKVAATTATAIPVAVGESFYRAGQDLVPVADAAKRFVMGAFGASPGASPGPIATAAAQTPTNATVSPTLSVPRGPGPQYGNEGRGGPQPADPYGPSQSVTVPQGGGTISTAGRTVSMPAAGMTDQQSQSIIGNPLINAELQRYQAQDAQRVQQGNEAMRQNGAWADAWTAQRDAANNARVANFRATNGADMVLAGGNSRHQPVQQAILNQQTAANAALNEANKTLAGVYGQKGPITDYVGQQQKQQQLDQQGRQTAADAAGKQAEIENKNLDAASKKQILELQQRLLGAKTPEERKSIEDMIVAIHGRSAQQDKVAIVDVDTGQKDMVGQPIYKKAAVNTVTGQLIGQPQQQGGADPAAALKGVPVAQAHAAAKKAIAEGAKLAEVNARLKAAGHPTL